MRNYTPHVFSLLVIRFLKLSRDHIILPVYLKTPTWLPEEYGGVLGGPHTNVSYHFGDMKQMSPGVGTTTDV